MWNHHWRKEKQAIYELVEQVKSSLGVFQKFFKDWIVVWGYATYS